MLDKPSGAEGHHVGERENALLMTCSHGIGYVHAPPRGFSLVSHCFILCLSSLSEAQLDPIVLDRSSVVLVLILSGVSWATLFLSCFLFAFSGLLFAFLPFN